MTRRNEQEAAPPVRKGQKWTREENDILFNNVRRSPQNMRQCFSFVALQTNRTPTGVAAHWYSVSKKPDAPFLLGLISSKYIIKNRKNGQGVESNPVIWRRLLNVLRDLFG